MPGLAFNTAPWRRSCVKTARSARHPFPLTLLGRTDEVDRIGRDGQVAVAYGLNSMLGGMSESGQGRDFFGFVGKDRIWIRKPPWRERYREKTGTAALDPSRTNRVPVYWLAETVFTRARTNRGVRKSGVRSLDGGKAKGSSA
jgi:hypothetical protein